MATRINFKFIAIITMTGITAVGIIGVLWILQTRGDAEHHAQLADSFYEEGNFRRAAESYSRAVGRDPANKAYLRKLEDTILQIRPETVDEARERYREWLNVLRHEMHHDTTNPKVYLRFIETVYQDALLLGFLGDGRGNRNIWEQIATGTNEMLFRVPEDHELYVYGRLYRGMANVQLRTALTDRDLEEALEDLRAFVEAFPDHDRGNAALIMGERLIADHLSVRLGSVRVAERYRLAEQHLQRALQRIPEGPEVQLAHVRSLLAQRDAGSETFDPDRLAGAIDSMMAAVQEHGDEVSVLDAAMLLRRTGTEGAAERAIALIEWHVNRSPEALVHRLLFADNLLRARRMDDAARVAQELIETGPVSVSFVGQMQLTIRQLATMLAAEVGFQRWYQAQDDVQRERGLEEMKDARARLTELVVDPENNRNVMRVEGQLAIVRSDYHTGAAMFERLIREGNADIETLNYAAYCLERIGEIGLAHQRLTESLQRFPVPNPQLLARKAMLEVQMGRFDDATRTGERLLAIEPESETAIQIAQYVRDRRDWDPTDDLDDPVAVALRSAEVAMREGDIEAARAALYAAMAGREQPDIRLLAGAAQVELNAGNMEQAGLLVEQALELAPDMLRLQQMRSLIETGDPFEAVLHFVRARGSDEQEQDIELMALYSAMAEQQVAAAESFEATEQMQRAEEARRTAERAKRESDRLMQRVLEHSATDPRVLDFEFTQALRDGNWSKAEQIIERAQRAGIDEADMFSLRGRLALARGNAEDAVRAFQRVVDQRPFAGEAWRGLGVAYQRAGNFREAVRALEQAHRINPNSLESLQRFVGLLVQIGDFPRALRIMRRVQSGLGRNPQLREVWLQLEAEHGDYRVALQQRRHVYQRIPSNRQNAIQYAVLLGRLNPTYDVLVDDDGEPLFTERRWSRMSTTEQNRILEIATAEWRQTAFRIVNEISERDGDDLQMVALKAYLYRQQDDVAAGENLFREYLAKQDSPEMKIPALLGLAEYHAESGQLDLAFQAADEAASLQPRGRRDAEQFAANLSFTLNMYEQARAYFEQVLEVSSELDVVLPYVQCLLNIGESDEAERHLDELERRGVNDFNLVMLRASLVLERSNRLFRDGLDAPARETRNMFEQLLEVAEGMMPSNPTPHIQRARALLADFGRTGRRTLLNDALSALTQADAVRAGDPRTSMARVDVLMAMGDERGALNELYNLVERSPRNFLAHRARVHLLIRRGELDRALAAVRDAEVSFSRSPVWPEVRGDIFMHQGKRNEAAESYMTAYSRGRSERMLRLAAITLLEGDSPNYGRVVEICQAHSDKVEGDPILMGMYAHALYRVGREQEADQRLRQSFRNIQQMIVDGTSDRWEISDWFRSFDALFRSRPPQEVEAIVMELTDSDPGPYVRYWLARYWRLLGSAGYSRAIELLTGVLETAPDGESQLLMTTYSDLAGTYYLLNDYEAAYKMYSAILDLVPDHALALNNIAFLLAAYLDRADEAETYTARAMELMPDHASVLDTAGWVKYKRGDYETAERYLRRSLELEETASTLLHLAQVLAATGRNEAAMVRLRRAAELDPDEKIRDEINRVADDIRTATATGQ